MAIFNNSRLIMNTIRIFEGEDIDFVLYSALVRYFSKPKKYRR